MDKKAYLKLMGLAKKAASPSDPVSWYQKLWARVVDPHEYVKLDNLDNAKKENSVFAGYDPHPNSYQGIYRDKVDSLKDYLKRSIGKERTANPAAAEELQLGKLFGPKTKQLHKTVPTDGDPSKGAVNAYIDTARVARRGELARKMLAIKNQGRRGRRSKLPDMWDILFNRWSWDE